MKYSLEMGAFGLAFNGCLRQSRRIRETLLDSFNFHPIARLLTAVLFLGVLILGAAPVSADWPGAVPKWSQLNPDNAGYSTYIDDEVDTGTTADDFLCASPLPIAEIRFRGSGWDNGNERPMNYPDKFRITFWSDVARTPDEESHPGTLLSDIYVNPAQSADPNKIGFQFLGSHNYLINLPQQDWFWQQGSPEHPIVYWIGIQAVMPINGNPEDFVWNFRNRNDATWGDDAVTADLNGGWNHWGWPSSDPTSFFPESYKGVFPSGWWKSADMCFEVSAIPEPSSFVLLGMGAVGSVFYGWRRRGNQYPR